ncbi:hypothetical protein CSB09_04330 [Candidatus Gracilibacteria bacterium]|nr:MAG: hypothetical protein CSB09_04330 [Candidatus Gracilibacteria bacterium]
MPDKTGTRTLYLGLLTDKQAAEQIRRVQEEIEAGTHLGVVKNTSQKVQDRLGDGSTNAQSENADRIKK